MPHPVVVGASCIAITGCNPDPTSEAYDLSQGQAEYFIDVEIPEGASELDAELEWSFDNYKTAFVAFRLPNGQVPRFARAVSDQPVGERASLAPPDLAEVHEHWDFADPAVVEVVQADAGQIVAAGGPENGTTQVFVVTEVLKQACGVVRDCD